LVNRCQGGGGEFEGEEKSSVKWKTKKKNIMYSERRNGGSFSEGGNGGLKGGKKKGGCLPRCRGDRDCLKGKRRFQLKKRERTTTIPLARGRALREEVVKRKDGKRKGKSIHGERSPRWKEEGGWNRKRATSTVEKKTGPRGRRGGRRCEKD